MKLLKVIRIFTFWFVLTGAFVCYLSMIGQDDKGLLLFSFGLDVIIYHAAYSDVLRPFLINDATDQYVWGIYVLKIVSSLIYGLLLDVVLYLIKKAQKAVNV